MATTSHVKLEEHEQREMDSLNKELREVQGKTMNVISQMININVDTLETIERQVCSYALLARDLSLSYARYYC